MLSLEEIVELDDLAGELNSQEYWDKAINGLKERYEYDKYDRETVLRLIFIIWYVTMEQECVGYRNKDLYFRRDIRKIYLETKDYFKDDLDYLLIIGYLMNYSPDYFTKNDFEEYENLGKEMVKKAFELNPQNIVSEFIYIIIIKDNNDNYIKFKKNMKKN